MGFDQLSGYKPEVPRDGSEPIKYEGPVIIEKSIVEENTKDSDFYPMGCNMIRIEATILDGDDSGRKLFKKFNLDSNDQDKKGKTPLQKLADQLWAVGLSFGSLEELKKVNENFVGMTVNVKAYPAKFPDGKEIQMWNIKGLASKTQGSGQKVAF